MSVDKVGFGGLNTQYGNIPFWNAGAFITNQSKTDDAQGVVAQATAYGSSGQVVGTGDTNVSVIRPGTTIPVAINLQVQGTPASVKVIAAAAIWISDLGSPTKGATITGSGIRITQNDEQYNILATLTSTYPMNLTNVAVYAVGTDASGNIMQATETMAPLVPANSSVGVQFIDYGPVPASVTIVGVPLDMTAVHGPIQG